MAVNKVVYGNTTLIDITDTTAIASDVAQGKYFYTNAGVLTQGTASGSATGQGIYCGNTTPSSSIGSNGDLYFVLSGGGSIEAYPSNYTAEDFSSTSNLGNCIGVSAEDGNSTQNAYSSGSSATGVAKYSFDLSGVPVSATISSISCQVKAHEENSSRSSFTLQLYAGDTAKGSQTTVSGTSNTIYNLTTGSWTRSELDSLLLVMKVGYYGGLIAGATLIIEYSATPQYNATIVGTANGTTISSNAMYQKVSGTWTQVNSATLEETVIRKD